MAIILRRHWAPHCLLYFYSRFTASEYTITGVIMNESIYIAAPQAAFFS